jgi:hypothetical protein
METVRILTRNISIFLKEITGSAKKRPALGKRQTKRWIFGGNLTQKHAEPAMP